MRDGVGIIVLNIETGTSYYKSGCKKGADQVAAPFEYAIYFIC